ncbi:ThiF family adenylyltransferase [Bacillus sp. NPDC094064]|uniref:ThiF family adenylyltransferase n=1 Tax=Bacillus sp. NPDC094064 TaxID=3390549 RepID=UPI003D06E794
MKLKTSLNFRGYPDKNEVVYYDGEERVIEVDEFEKLWSLLKILENPKGNILENIYAWKIKNRMEDQELQNIIEFINENHLVYKQRYEEETEEQLFNFRNSNYFSVHDRTVYADTIVQKMKSLKVVVIGAGTIGATLCMTLSKIGVGEIIIIDFDTVESKNIRAQTVFQTEDIHKKKIDVIQEKLNRMDPYVKTQGFDMKIETIHDLLQVDLSGVNYIFGSFDEASLQLHKDIMDYCDKENMKYFLMGYHNDFVKVLNVSNYNDGNVILENSFNNYHTDNVICENRGTIIQSLAVSLIITRILFEDITNEKHHLKDGYSFDFINFQTTTNNTFKPQYETFIQSLQSIIPLEPDKLRRQIKEISNVYYAAGRNLPKVMELEILSMHQAFDILIHMDQLSHLQLEEAYNEFLTFINDIEELDGDEEEYERYLQMIRSIRIPYDGEIYSIFEVFEIMRSLKNSGQKEELQKDIYDILKNKGNKILQFFIKSKKRYLAMESSNYYMEVFGVKEETLFTLEEKLQQKFHDLIMKSLSLIFSNSSGEVQANFLTYNEEQRTTVPIHEAKEIIVTSLKKHGQDRWTNYIERMFQDNLIQIYNEVEVNKTYYFPSIKESRILCNYHDDVDSLFILCHELGHAYFNKSYDESFFDDSTQLLNEVMAYYFEITCVQAILRNDDVGGDIRKEIARQYVKRIHQVVLSTYSVHLFEKSLIKHVQEYGEISIKEFLKIREEYNKHPFFEGIRFQNETYSYFNPLLKASFIFEFGDHVLPPIAYLLSVRLCREENSTIPKDIQIQEALFNGIYRTEDFLNYMSKELSYGEFMEQAMDELLQQLYRLQSVMLEEGVCSD